MNDDGGATGHLERPLEPPAGDALPEVLNSSPAATLVVDAEDGLIYVISPAGSSLLSRPGAEVLADWLTQLATEPHRRTDTATLRTWTLQPGPDGRCDPGAVSVSCLPIRYRGRDCVLLVLHELASSAAGSTTGTPAPPLPTVGVLDEISAAFTLDILGRVDSWNCAAQRIMGFAAEEIIGADTGTFYPPTTRLAGEPHQALTRAYRTGEHRAEGWRMRADGSPMWAETTTIALRDPQDRLAGFGVVVRDLTTRRRVGPRIPGPAARRPTSRRTVPTQRRPVDG
jgi:PAS domain S-box-containing protein